MGFLLPGFQEGAPQDQDTGCGIKDCSEVTRQHRLLVLCVGTVSKERTHSQPLHGRHSGARGKRAGGWAMWAQTSLENAGSAKIPSLLALGSMPGPTGMPGQGTWPQQALEEPPVPSLALAPVNCGALSAPQSTPGLPPPGPERHSLSSLPTVDSRASP